jgi:hypothetical protein
MSQNTLKEIVQEMDSDLGGIGLRTENLDVISNELDYLRQDMDKAMEEHAGNFAYLGMYMLEVHNKVKLLNDYLNVTLNNLEGDLNQTQDKHKALFELLVQKQ